MEILRCESIKCDMFMFSILDEMAIIDKFAEVNAEYVGKHAYIGIQSEIGKKSIIGESAVILEFAVLPSHVFVLPTEIVARTPTSLCFYRQCAGYILDDEYEPFDHFYHRFY